MFQLSLIYNFNASHTPYNVCHLYFLRQNNHYCITHFRFDIVLFVIFFINFLGAKNPNKIIVALSFCKKNKYLLEQESYIQQSAYNLIIKIYVWNFIINFDTSKREELLVLNLKLRPSVFSRVR